MTLGARRAGVFRHTVKLLVYIQGHRVTLCQSNQVGIAMTAEAVPIGCARLVQHAANSMRLMTVDAHRDDIRLLAPQTTLYDLPMDLLDLRMTLLTRQRDVVTMDAGCWVRVGQDLVRRVA